MGAQPDRFPPMRSLTDGERAELMPRIAADGTMARVREVAGWSRARLAQHLGVAAATVAAWEDGTTPVPPAAAGPLWSALVELCYTPHPEDTPCRH